MSRVGPVYPEPRPGGRRVRLSPALGPARAGLAGRRQATTATAALGEGVVVALLAGAPGRAVAPGRLPRGAGRAANLPDA
eukprot:CAMPEP_0118995456 /NCGR_PEP_ID=MMETSP1173-20130426/58507_1 /TAXON_ID=1034831 /ORGANISM="Rhizochromulina marina cf, Strain CCMP1243" /LENGTH=79 /DNA_ID=CAMNT_0006946795 /DNA_START=178 /DNA_END=417 /DNA_ORIENTATION=+